MDDPDDLQNEERPFDVVERVIVRAASIEICQDLLNQARPNMRGYWSMGWTIVMDDTVELEDDGGYAFAVDVSVRGYARPDERRPEELVVPVPGNAFEMARAVMDDFISRVRGF